MINISQVKRWRESLGATHLVIFVIDRNGRQHVATHGETEKNAKEAAIMGNNLKKILEWPDDQCRAKPLERKCKNCTYYKPNRGIHCFNGWSGDGSTGNCLHNPNIRPMTKDSDKCSKFDPSL